MNKYYYSKEGVSKGPYTIDELLLENINENTLIWHEDLTDWRKAGDIAELKSFLKKNPPPLPKDTQQKKPFFSNKLIIIFSSFIFIVLLILVIQKFESNKLEKYNKYEVVKEDTIKEKKSLISVDQAIKIAEKKFSKYAPNIESEGKNITYSKTFNGDLNNDGLDEIVIYFVCTPKSGGNMIVGREAAIYLNMGSTVKAITALNPEYPFHIQSIKENRLIVVEEVFDENDSPGFPSKGKLHYFILNGETLQEIVE